MASKPLCIYHGNCADGFGAAWVVRKYFREVALDRTEVDFHAGVYQNPPPDVTGRDVIMVDFSYKSTVIEKMRESSRSILILDHHKTAAEDLAYYLLPDPAPSWYAWLKSAHQRGSTNAACGAIFDMNRSGAMLAWDYFFADMEAVTDQFPRPKLLDHIQDRDLWLFKLEGTREIQANVFSYPYDFAVWDELMAAPIHTHLSDGRAIERKHHKDVAELVGVTKRRMVIGGHDVPVASLPYTLTSDAGHLMAKGEPFAACYWDTADGRVMSLRSTDEGVDVSAIAKAYGGGGHRNASGFRMPLGWEGDQKP